MGEHGEQDGARTLSGVAMMGGFCAVGPGIDIFAKLATAEVATPVIALARFAVQCALLGALLLAMRGLRRPTRPDLLIHAGRGALIALATLFFFTALTELPVADAMAIFFVEPMILTLLSGPVLGERIGWRRYAACAVGFGGALLVIQPSFQEVGWVAAAPLGTALCFAFYLILTRRITQRAGLIEVQFWAGLFGAATLAIGMLAAGDLIGGGLAAPPASALWMLAGVGLCATVAHLLLTGAFARAPASVLAPFQYLEIVGAVAFGYLVFGDFPDPLKWLGVAIIVGSGLVILRRERAAARAVSLAPPP